MFPILPLLLHCDLPLHRAKMECPFIMLFPFLLLTKQIDKLLILLLPPLMHHDLHSLARAKGEVTTLTQ